MRVIRLPVSVIVVVAVAVPVIVAALVNRNDTVDLIDAVDDRGSTRFTWMAALRVE